jgi:hypothetical protein
MFQKVDLFPSSGDALLSPLERSNLNHWTSPKTPNGVGVSLPWFYENDIAKLVPKFCHLILMLCFPFCAYVHYFIMPVKKSVCLFCIFLTEIW